MQSLELLAPARTADIGIEAIRHGADAVYIGGPQFGARAAAGNSVEDIARLVAYAHLFGAKIYVTINTLLHDDELPQALSLMEQLHAVGVDAFIVQDMNIHSSLFYPHSSFSNPHSSFYTLHSSFNLHASTQMDNRTPEKVRWLWEHGYEQVVLARELTIDEIRSIHQACPEVRLEVFVHGALCVSLSGRCNISEVAFGRSANRGVCAQVCRMEFDLEDEQGLKLMKKKHLLSLKDLCHLDVLEELAEAGASSFKIEGRLKDMAYVKNVTAAYSEALNALCARYPDRYCRASKGQVELRFRPDVNKSFNRGFTHYFLHGRNADIFSFDTPKALGSPVGECTAVTPHSILVKPTSPLVNGDGLCFFNQNHTLIGFRVNRVEKRTTVYPHIMPKDLMPGMRLYRNFDKQFTDILAGESAERFIPVDITIDYDGQAFILTFDDGTNIHVARHEYTPELAHTHQSENVIRQLSRLGGTIYRARRVEILYQKNYFIPSSLLAEWRRELVEKKETHPQPGTHPPAPPCEGGEYIPAIQDTSPDYECLANRVTTPLPRREGFCPPITGEPSSTCRLRSKNGVQRPLQGGGSLPLMLCRHCLRYALGWCYKRQDKPQAGSPPQLYLRLANGMRFRLSFDCQQCMMLVYEDKPSRQTTIGQTPITTEQK